LVVLKNDINAEVGDRVEIKGKTGDILKLTMIVYFVPFTLMLIGIFSGLKIFKNMGIANYEPLSFLLGLVCLGIGYFLVRMFDNSFGKKENNTIMMTKII
jgi:sigma-E factor negative regulatory protein RseC